MIINSRFWIRFSIFNLLLVAFLGLIMRYKIGFEFPFLNQKNLQNSHYQFAFVGWISQSLMVLMVHFLKNHIDEQKLSKYKLVFILNLIAAYGLLFSFILWGYSTVSIAFSIMAVLVSYLFSFYYFKDLKGLKNNFIGKKWFQAALFFNVISSLGTFALVYMKLTHTFSQDLYLASVYYYLHFQYNGWFWFAMIGLFLGQLKPSFALDKNNNAVFWWFALSCIPAYLLSILWIDLPIGLYILAVIAAFIQVLAWIKFIKKSVSLQLSLEKPILPLFRNLIYGIVFCISIKLLLQLGSVIPAVSTLTFGFRSIVIAYLHLVLLAIFSVFILVYLFVNHLVPNNSKTRMSLILFVTGVFLNEIVLAVQGIASFSYTVIPYVNLMLFVITIGMFSGIALLNFFSIKNVNKSTSL